MENIIIYLYKKRVLLVFSFLAIFKLLLLGEGYLEDTDEMPFVPLLVNFNALISLDIDAWIYQVDIRWSTFIETLIRLPQAAVLKLYAHWKGLSTTSPEALNIIGIFNLSTNMLLLVFQYKIFKKINFNTNESLTGIFILGTLLNPNLYLTHILPYESSLLFHTLSLYILTAKDLNNKKLLFSGFFSALGFFNYYGNFPFLFITWGFMLVRIYPNIISFQISKLKFEIPYNSIFKSFILVTPIFSLLLILHGISLSDSFSYLNFLKTFSKSIFMGSPEETLSYAFIYFKLVEKAWGMILLFISIGALLYIIFYRRFINKVAKQLFIISFFTYIIYGIQGVITESMVFYGRVFHLFYFFIILGVLVIIRIYPRLKYFLWIGTFINILYVYTELKSMGFPRSAMSKLEISGSYKNCFFINELNPYIDHSYRGVLDRDDDESIEVIELYIKPFRKSKETKNKYILKNFSFFEHYPDSFINSYTKYYPPNDAVLIYSRTHFMSHPAFTLEYCTRNGRDFFLDKKIKLEVYKQENTVKK